MDHENAFQTGPTKVVSASTYLRLRFMDRASLEPLRDALSEEEISDLLRRRDYILSYFDRLVQQQGYENTIIDTSAMAASGSADCQLQEPNKA